MRVSSGQNLINKKVAVLGLGTEGSSLCRFLVKQGAEVTGCDQKDFEELGDLDQSLDRSLISYQLGKNYLKDLDRFEIIYRSPGIYRYRPEIVQAEKKGVQVSSETILFFQLCPAPIVGVTGTKGKGTTSLLIGEMLKDSGEKAFVAGNLGPAKLELLSQLDQDAVVVLELSSFQLIDCLYSPKIAVVLNIFPDHLNWHQDFQAYLEAKKNLVRHQTVADMAVLDADDQYSQSFAPLTKARLYWTSPGKKLSSGTYLDQDKIVINHQAGPLTVGSINNVRLKGRHNWKNILASVTASFLAGASQKGIAKALRSFTGFPHRLEEVAKIRNVLYVNDSASTLPETAVAAIKTYQEPIVLICGGAEKHSDYTKLGQVVAEGKVKAVILIGQIAPRIAKAIKKAGYQGRMIKGGSSMAEIVAQAKKIALPGEVVLFSPACTSFDMFLNYQDRGNQFIRTVKNYFKTSQSR